MYWTLCTFSHGSSIEAISSRCCFRPSSFNYWVFWVELTINNIHCCYVVIINLLDLFILQNLLLNDAFCRQWDLKFLLAKGRPWGGVTLHSQSFLFVSGENSSSPSHMEGEKFCPPGEFPWQDKPSLRFAYRQQSIASPWTEGI